MATIGPHEGKELELMLKNTKNIALFYSDYDIPDDFIPYLANGTFRLEDIKLLDRHNNIFFYYIIYNPAYENEAKYLAYILQKSVDIFDPFYERKIGELLGYSDEDIQYYLEVNKPYISISKSSST